MRLIFFNRLTHRPHFQHLLKNKLITSLTSRVLKCWLKKLDRLDRLDSIFIISVFSPREIQYFKKRVN